jgi:hypothetical protein
MPMYLIQHVRDEVRREAFGIRVVQKSHNTRPWDVIHHVLAIIFGPIIDIR